MVRGAGETVIAVLIVGDMLAPFGWVAGIRRAVNRIRTIERLSGAALLSGALVFSGAKVSVIAGRPIRFEAAFSIFASVIRANIAVVADKGLAGRALAFDATLFSVATVFIVAI